MDEDQQAALRRAETDHSHTAEEESLAADREVAAAEREFVDSVLAVIHALRSASREVAHAATARDAQWVGGGHRTAMAIAHAVENSRSGTMDLVSKGLNLDEARRRREELARSAPASV